MEGEAHTQVINDVNLYSEGVDIVFRRPDGSIALYVPERRNGVSATGDGYVTTGVHTAYTNIASVTSNHTWYSHSGDMGEAIYYEYSAY